MDSASLQIHSHCHTAIHPVMCGTFWVLPGHREYRLMTPGEKTGKSLNSKEKEQMSDCHVIVVGPFPAKVASFPSPAVKERSCPSYHSIELVLRQTNGIRSCRSEERLVGSYAFVKQYSFLSSDFSPCNPIIRLRIRRQKRDSTTGRMQLL